MKKALRAESREDWKDGQGLRASVTMSKAHVVKWLRNSGQGEALGQAG